MVTLRSKRSVLACCLLGHGSELEISSIMGEWEQEHFLVEGV